MANPTFCLPPAVGATLVALVVASGTACGNEPDATSCVAWEDLERTAGTMPLAGRVAIRGPGEGRVYPGLYSIGDVENGTAAFKDKSEGRAPAIAFTFHDWTGEVEGGGFDVNGRLLRDFNSALEGESMTPLEFMAAADADGAVAAISWEALGYYVSEPGYYLGFDTRVIKHQEILAGDFDAYIRHVAVQIRDSGIPVMLSPLGEFGVAGHASYGADAFRTKDHGGGVCDQYGDPAWPDGPERIRDIYRHIIDLFRDEGVTNVTWFMYASTGYMNASAADFEWEHPGYYYPGDDYIDWIGNSLYFTDDTSLMNEDIGDLAYALDAGLAAWREVTDRPFFAPEFAMSTRGQESAADLLEATLDALPQSGVAAFTYADAPLFKEFFSLPRLGTFDDERDIWNAALDRDEYVLNVVVDD